MLILRNRTLILRRREILGGPIHLLLDDASEADGWSLAVILIT